MKYALCFIAGLALFFALPYINYDFRVWYSRHLMDCMIRIAPDVKNLHIDGGYPTKKHYSGVCYN